MLRQFCPVSLHYLDIMALLPQADAASSLARGLSILIQFPNVEKLANETLVIAYEDGVQEIGLMRMQYREAALHPQRSQAVRSSSSEEKDGQSHVHIIVTGMLVGVLQLQNVLVALLMPRVTMVEYPYLKVRLLLRVPDVPDS